MISSTTEYLTYYPTNYTRTADFEDFGGVVRNAHPTSLYIHVPFCRAICPFCNYNKFEFSVDQPRSFISSLCHEIELWTAAGVDFTGIEALYVGGGTPSVVPASAWSELLNVLQDKVEGISSLSIECHPADASATYAASLREAGFNRISLGTQSFAEETLKALGSHHDAAQTRSCIENSLRGGFDDVAIDLLFLVPGQRLADFGADLEEALKLSVTHISTYRLLLDPSAPMGRRIRLGRSKPQPIGLEHEMAEMALDRFAMAGWNHYGSCSSTGYDFAVRGFESAYEVQHRGAPQGDMLAVGTGASGYLNGRGYWTTHTFPEYVKQVALGELPALCWTPANRDEERRRYAVLGFKHITLPLAPYLAMYGTKFTDDFADEVAQLVEGDLVEVSDDNLTLNRRGILHLDGVCKLFHSSESREWDQPYRPELQVLSIDLAATSPRDQIE